MFFLQVGVVICQPLKGPLAWKGVSLKCNVIQKKEICLKGGRCYKAEYQVSQEFCTLLFLQYKLMS